MKKLMAVVLAFICVLSLFGCGQQMQKTSKEIATYSSPDGEYSIVFEQMGDPGWPFGPTDVRLTLKNRNDEIIERVSTMLFDDGVPAGEHNIASISWGDDAVMIILNASEMKAKEVSIAYNKD